MKKILVSFILVLTFSSVSFAWVPLLIGAVNAAFALHAVGYATGLFFNMTPNRASAVSSSGDVSRPSNAVWIDLTLPIPAVVEKPITTKMSIDKLQELAALKNANDTYKYPLVEAAIREWFQGPTPPSVQVQDGSQHVLGAGGYVGLSGVPSPEPLYNKYILASAGSQAVINYFQTPYWNGSQMVMGLSQWVDGGLVFTPPPIKQAKPVGPAVAALTAANTNQGGAVNSAYQTELDKMFQDSAYVPVFTDDTTGLPFVAVAPSPEHVSTPAAVDYYNTYGPNPVTSTTGAPVTVNNSNGTSTTTTTTIINGGSASPSTSTTSVTTSGPDGTGTVVDSKVEESGTEVPVLPGDNVYVGGQDSDKPIMKNIKDILASIVASSPLVAMVQSFTISASGTGNIPVGTLWEDRFGGTTMTLDFTRWEAFLRTLGGILLAVFHGYAVKIALKGW